MISAPIDENRFHNELNNQRMPNNDKAIIISAFATWGSYAFFFLLVEEDFSLFVTAYHCLIALAGVALTWLMIKTLVNSELSVPAMITRYCMPAFIIAFGLAFIEADGGFQQLLMRSRELVLTAALYYLLLMTSACLHLAIVMDRKARVAAQESQSHRLANWESERRALRYQLDPHFVFNALNSVSSLILERDNDRAEWLLENLSDYMRDVIAYKGDRMVSVEEETAQQIRYLDIQKTRFPEILDFTVVIEDQVKDWRLPALILQPLVENAVKYGVRKDRKPFHITLSAREEAGRLLLSIINNSPLIEANIRKKESGTRTGLQNVRSRLEAVYGPAASLLFGEDENGNTVASIVVPNEERAIVAA